MKLVASFISAVTLAFMITASCLVFVRLLLFGHDQIGFSQINYLDSMLSSSWVTISADWSLTVLGVVTWLILPLVFLASYRGLLSIVRSKTNSFYDFLSFKFTLLKIPLITVTTLLAILVSMQLPEIGSLPNGNGGVLGIILLGHIPLEIKDHLAFGFSLFVITSILSFFTFPEIRFVSLAVANVVSSFLLWLFVASDKNDNINDSIDATVEQNKPKDEQTVVSNIKPAHTTTQSMSSKSDRGPAAPTIKQDHQPTEQPALQSEQPAASSSLPTSDAAVVETNKPPEKKTKWLYHSKKSKTAVKATATKTGLSQSKAFQNAQVSGFRMAIHKILAKPTTALSTLDTDQQLDNAHSLKNMLADFNLQMEIGDIITGPVVTRYEFQPPAGFKVAQLVSLTKDLARVLKVSRVRVVETIVGKSTIGIELPNEERLPVTLGGIIDTEQWQQLQSEYALPVVIGRTVEGNPMIIDIAAMPHLLVAGTTGSGKSVGVNSMLISALATYSPEELRLVLVDPKILEFSSFKGLPHLLCDVVTEMDKSDKVLEWCVTEMDRRYRKLADAGVRNIGQYNERAKEGMPYLLIIIDEWADMMMATGKKSETLVVRLAQKARACGIHLILATQRPSVDVITGLMKSNIPARLCYQVASSIDSRTMLDSGGGELLLGKGDALIKKGGIDSTRVHGAFVTDEEIEQVVAYWKAQAHNYIDLDTLSLDDLVDQVPPSDSENMASDLYHQALDVARTSDRVSISKIQRKLGIGFNRAANFVEQMEDEGLVSAPDHKGVRTFIG